MFPSDVLPLASFSTQAVAWVGVVTSLALLLRQGYEIVRNRKKERREIDEALDRQPMVKEQLQLGNVGAAVEQLSAIIDQMAQARQRSDQDYELRIRVLEARGDELESEAADWERRYHQANEEWEKRYTAANAEWGRRYTALDERCRKITAVLRRHNWDVDET